MVFRICLISIHIPGSNFPFMVPFWTIGHVLACGNTLVLKPSEKCPLTMHRVAAILEEAGVPAGVFNLIHGTVDGKETWPDSI